MKDSKLEKIPLLYKNGQMSEKQAINKIAVFIFRNTPLFQLHKFDEDFREEIIGDFIEKGSIVINTFKPDLGEFFPYLYSYINNLIHKKLKANAIIQIREKCTLHDIKTEAMFDCEKYGILTPVFCAEPKVPFIRNKVTPEELAEAFKCQKLSKREKITFTVLLKYIFFIDEFSLYEICMEHKLNYPLLIHFADICRKSLDKKIQNIKKLENSRNNSYYFHKNYKSKLSDINNENTNIENPQKQIMNQKLNRHTKIWINKNFTMEHHAGNLVTSNKLIAKLMGICERQVRYYLELVWKSPEIIAEEK